MELDSAPVIGAVGVAADGLDAPYWEGLEQGRLMIQRCPDCGGWIWSPQWACPRCRRLEPGWEPVEATGLIYSWTRTWQPFAPEFADLVPYRTAVVELPHAGGVRLLGLLLGDDRVDPIIGAAVNGVIQPASALTGGVPQLRWRAV